MPLSIFGWIDGITAAFVVFSGVIMALLLFHKWRVNNVRMHFYTGLIILFAGFCYLGVYLDFIAVLLTGQNITNTHGRVALLSYIWIPPLFTLGIIVFADILIPNKKKYLALIYIILSIFFYIAILTDPYGSFYFVYPENPGEELIDYYLNLTSLAGIYVITYQLSILAFIFFGFLPKALKSKPFIRRNFFYIIIGILMITIPGAFESWAGVGIFTILIRVCYMFGFYLWYLGLQPVKEYLNQTQENEITEEFEIEDIATSVAEKLGVELRKPEALTKEEIAFYKEQTICLVCRKNFSRYTSLFICPECKSLYCQKCAQALTELENVCWSCDTPLDDTKPVKRIIKDKEKVRIEKSEKLHKNNGKSIQHK